MDVEKGHDKVGTIFGRELVGESNVCQAGGKIALIEGHSFRPAGCPTSVQEESNILLVWRLNLSLPTADPQVSRLVAHIHPKMT